MISLTVDNNKISFKGKGNNILVYTEELLAISFLRDELAKQLNTTAEITNRMIIEALLEEE